MRLMEDEHYHYLSEDPDDHRETEQDNVPDVQHDSTNTTQDTTECPASANIRQ
jgi:hypothetical protein